MIGSFLTWATLAVATVLPRQSTSLDQFVSTQHAYSLGGVLSNIGTVAGTTPGVVIASPSLNNPDYFFTWTRDAALVEKALVAEIINGNSSLNFLLTDYATAQQFVQRISNPSGDFSTGGLGEPKYNIRGGSITAFTGSWGRPQRDGPALRSTTLINYANYLTANGNATYAKNTLLPLITADLDYVVTYWNQTGFDLWEEVQGSSFFTLAAQYRSLIEGSDYLNSIGAGNSKYSQAAAGVLCFLQDFWSPSSGYMVANINTNNGRSGKDSNTFISTTHTYDSSATDCSSATFQPCSDRALANHKVVTDSFRAIYGINTPLSANQAVGVGRYSEDSYYGGNPWYISTLSAGEQLYYAVNTWNRAGSLNVTSLSLPFFQALVPNVAVGNYVAGSTQFVTITAAVRTYADGFLATVQKYVGLNGALSEQFDRSAGKPLSARDLTWSYAAFVTASNARNGKEPSPWRSNSIRIACGSFTSPPVNPTTPGGSPTGPSPPSSGFAFVTFNVIADTKYGQNIFLAGSISEVGNWDTSKAIPLSASKYTSSNHLWFVTASLPASTRIEYKFIRKESNGQVTYQSGSNRVITTGAAGSTSTVNTNF